MATCKTFLSERAILDLLANRMFEYLHQSFNIDSTKDDVVFFSDMSFLKLSSVNAVIYGKGNLNCAFLFSVTDKVAKQILNGFLGGDEVSAEEEQELIASCVGEALNVVLGNIMASFEGDYQKTGFGSPIIGNGEEVQSKLQDNCEIMGFIVSSSVGDYTLAYLY